MNAAEFRAAFDAAFGPHARAAGLTPRGGKTPKWRREAAGHTLTIGVRLNMKNLAGYPGGFMPDITWSGPGHDPSDAGHVSWYQYSTAFELDAVTSLRKQIVQVFVAERGAGAQQTELGRKLVPLIVDASESPIRPHQETWLPYWHDEDAADWGHLFGRALDGWLRRFDEAPETLDSWCWRVLWKK